MNLMSFSVQRFRNILESGTITVDPAVTCLVGKNESGKTNLLHALHAVHPAPTDRKFDEQQYPRWLQKADQRSGAYASAVPISVDFELSDADMEAVEQRFGTGTLKSTMMGWSLRYSDGGTFSLDIDEEAVCEACESQYGTSTGATKVAALKSELMEAAAETVADEAGSQIPAVRAQQARTAGDALEQLVPEGLTLDQAVRRFLKPRVPQFFYFDDYSQLRGRTDIGPLIEALRTKTEATLDEAQRTALALLKLGFATEDLIDADYERRSGEMEAVAADLSHQVMKYWHQNDHLRLRIDIESEEQTQPNGQHIINRFLQLRVEDTRHFFTNNLDVRSSGFRWFVSFLAAFKEFSSDRSVIVLLDEPALALHARAQRDFLEFIEDTLGAGNQVIYTTHSVFMIDPAHLERVRVVEDMGPEEGTKVKQQLMSRDPDTLSPLQGALGYDIAQNIFVGPDNLVVEGLSDHTYLMVMSEVLRAKGRTFLDLRWRILAAGGAGAMPAAVSLLGQELDVTVVVDGGSKPPQRLNGLVEEEILQAKRIITLGPIAGMNAADIEDMFDPEDYLNLYNSALGASLTVEDLGDESDRIVARIARKDGAYNHNDPSNWLLTNRETATVSLRPATLDRFERLIHAANATLRGG